MNVMASNAESSSGLDSIFYRSLFLPAMTDRSGRCSVDVVLGAATLLLCYGFELEFAAYYFEVVKSSTVKEPWSAVKSRATHLLPIFGDGQVS
ncbi:hypothetical protein Nepgr_021699 [Nepenthes gracilis]|uniref:Uncharacterized protein n=1 Tax=Nepenthes gracilis TaxID=150966 RepID=A0AAD3XWA5_NEPGR|nr:hypothetical protein Nepgr_021699 [Nepenthes gracilis]